MRCHRCDSHGFTAARAVGLYEGALREAVLRLKRGLMYRGMSRILLVAAAGREPLSESTRIMPVPLHPKRLRDERFQSGFSARTSALEEPSATAGRSKPDRGFLGRRNTVLVWMSKDAVTLSREPSKSSIQGWLRARIFC